MQFAQQKQGITFSFIAVRLKVLTTFQIKPVCADIVMKTTMRAVRPIRR